MGKNQKTQRNEQLRELREKQQREALAKKKKEQRLMLIIALSALALILFVVGISVLLTKLIDKNDATLPAVSTDPSNAPIQYHLADTNTYTASKTATNYVKLNVSYTADDGQRHNGDIIIKLDSQNAPLTVANFQKLVGEGFYDGLTFHRVIEDFMIQGGDPKGDGTGGSDEEIKGEFATNGVNNTLSHERGVISMARSDDYNSASSQFFIVHKTSPHLDGLYAAFGRVVFGMESVDGIATVATNSKDKPLKEAKIVSAVFVNYTEQGE